MGRCSEQNVYDRLSVAHLRVSDIMSPCGSVNLVEVGNMILACELRRSPTQDLQVHLETETWNQTGKHQVAVAKILSSADQF